MADRRLVTVELDPLHADYGKMYGLPAGNATGVALPAFQVVTARPVAGSEKGQAVYETNSRQAWVWDGNTWKAVAATPMLTFKDEATMRADTTSPVATYAITTDTGALFVKRTTGWALVGIKEYPTVANLLADAPVVGVLGYALDEASQWLMTPNGWEADDMRRFATTAGVLAWGGTAEVQTVTVTSPAAAAGTEKVGLTINGTAVEVTAAAAATPAQVAAALLAALQGTAALAALTFAQPAGTATVLVTGTQAGEAVVITVPQNVTAAQTTAPVAAKGVHTGDRALALDTGTTYVRLANGWRPTSIYEAPEATIRAATWALNGQEAIATDTGRTFTRIGGNWLEEPVQHYATEVLLLAATVPDGVLAWADDTNVVFTRAAGTWHRLQGPQITVGETAPTTPGTGDQWLQPSTSRLEVWGGAAWITPNSGAKLIARRNLDFHHFTGDVWEVAVDRWFKPASAGAKVGNLIMAVMTINVAKFHTGSIKLSSRVRLGTAANAFDGGWVDYNSAGTSHETSATVSSIFVGKIDDVDARLLYSASTFGAGGGNGDRQGWGYIAVWDMGPENMPGIDPM